MDGRAACWMDMSSHIVDTNNVLVKHPCSLGSPERLTGAHLNELGTVAACEKMPG